MKIKSCEEAELVLEQTPLRAGCEEFEGNQQVQEGLHAIEAARMAVVGHEEDDRIGIPRQDVLQVLTQGNVHASKRVDLWPVLLKQVGVEEFAGAGIDGGRKEVLGKVKLLLKRPASTQTRSLVRLVLVHVVLADDRFVVCYALPGHNSGHKMVEGAIPIPDRVEARPV